MEIFARNPMNRARAATLKKKKVRRANDLCCQLESFAQSCLFSLLFTLFAVRCV